MVAKHTKGIRVVYAVFKEYSYWAIYEDANVLCQGQKFIELYDAKEIIKFFNEDFEGARHLRRLNKNYCLTLIEIVL